jgi:hypothetical protein
MKKIAGDSHAENFRETMKNFNMTNIRADSVLP